MATREITGVTQGVNVLGNTFAETGRLFAQNIRSHRARERPKCSQVEAKKLTNSDLVWGREDQQKISKASVTRFIDKKCRPIVAKLAKYVDALCHYSYLIKSLKVRCWWYKNCPVLAEAPDAFGPQKLPKTVANRPIWSHCL